MSDWQPTLECNDRCYGEPCVHRSKKKKPGFFEGLLAGMDEQEKEVDSPQLAEVKELISSKDLTASERAELAAWLFGDALKSSIISALSDDPPTR